MTTVSDDNGTTTPEDPTPDVLTWDESVQPESPAYSSEHVLPSEPPRTPSSTGRVVLPLALAVVSVVALGAGWVHLESDRAAEATAARTAAVAKPPVPTLSAGASASADASASASASPSPSASASASASSSTSSSASTSPSASASASPSASPSATKPVVDRAVSVVVYNATSRTGLAAAVAAQLRAKGWTVVSIGNWRRGGVSQTTVFVNGRKDAAATMRRDFKAADLTRTLLAGMPGGRLVVVVAGDYPN